MNIRPYMKVAVAVAIALLTALQAAITDSTVTGNEWLTIGLAVVTALGVYLVPNKPVGEQQG